MTTKNSSPRVAKLRDEAKKKGWRRRDYYATVDEHEVLTTTLIKQRQGQGKPDAMDK